MFSVKVYDPQYSDTSRYYDRLRAQLDCLYGHLATVDSNGHVKFQVCPRQPQMNDDDHWKLLDVAISMARAMVHQLDDILLDKAQMTQYLQLHAGSLLPRR